MSKPKVHLHRSYRSAWCGRDAAHIPMTYDRKDVTCATCLKADAAEQRNEEQASAT